MPGIDELLRIEGDRWRAEIDTHRQPSVAPTRVSSRRPWSSPRGRVWTVSLAGVAAAAVVVLAVGLGTSSDGSDRSGSSDTARGSADVESAPGAARASAAAAPALNPGGGASAPARAPVSPTSLILTGSLALTVRTNDAVDRAATLATGIAGGAGGRVDADSRSTTAQHSATLVLRVPNAALPGVTRQLTALGTVRSQNLQTRDVTTQVADVNSRVTSARAAIAGLTRLYARARTVSELIAVESALSARQGDLEALETQQRTLAAQTSFATVTVSIDVRTPAAAAHHADRSGFVGGLDRGWHAFTSTLRAIATGLGVALPFLAVVLVAAIAALITLRRRRSSAGPVVDPDTDAGA